MTVSLDLPTRPRMEASVPAPAASPQGAMLLRVLRVLERANIPCCILHGYENYPTHIKGDVDCLIPAEFLPQKLAETLHAHREEIGGKMVQWFEDGAHLIVLAGKAEDGSPVLLQLHATSRYEMEGRIFFEADEILKGRRKHRDFFVPAAEVEFACVLANKLAKKKLTEDHGSRLSALFEIDPQACSRQADRLFNAAHAKLIVAAARSNDWSAVRQSLAALRQDILSSSAGRPAPGGMVRKLKKLSRWLRPRNGFHAVFLGPDGVGKSTTIEAFQRDLEPAFLHGLYLTFAPGLLPQKFAPPKPDGPHSLPKRSLPASLLKAAWWSVCYTAGYYATVHPTLARGGLVVNHRYLVDAIVDQKRYRYSGPVWLLKWIWAIAPKPDVVILLDAAPEVIQRRKQEVPFEETARQVQAYRTVIGKLSIGKIIDAAQPRPAVAAQVEWLVLDRQAERIVRRFSLGGKA